MASIWLLRASPGSFVRTNTIYRTFGPTNGADSAGGANMNGVVGPFESYGNIRYYCGQLGTLRSYGHGGYIVNTP